MELSQSERQVRMLLLYGDLISELENWGGKLVLVFGPDANLVPIPVSIAGGTTLLIDDDAANVKAVMRRGELDFVVNSLDEALRVLKNQIRQKRSVSVGLIAGVSPILSEMIERGVHPDFLLRSRQEPTQEALEGLVKQFRAKSVSVGYIPTRFLGEVGNEYWDPALIVVRRKRNYAWHVESNTLATLRSADEILLSRFANDDPRRRWLERIPKYVRDSVEAGRWVLLTKEESDQLRDELPINPKSLP